jgi:hypothetical protein
MADRKNDEEPQTSQSESRRLVARPPPDKSFPGACIEHRRIYVYSSCHKRPKHFRQTSSFLDQCDKHEGTAKACHIHDVSTGKLASGLLPKKRTREKRSMPCPECAESDVSTSSAFCNPSNSIYLHQTHFNSRRRRMIVNLKDAR